MLGKMKVFVVFYANDILSIFPDKSEATTYMERETSHYPEDENGSTYFQDEKKLFRIEEKEITIH